MEAKLDNFRQVRLIDLHGIKELARFIVMASFATEVFLGLFVVIGEPTTTILLDIDSSAI